MELKRWRTNYILCKTNYDTVLHICATLIPSAGQRHTLENKSTKKQQRPLRVACKMLNLTENYGYQVLHDSRERAMSEQRWSVWEAAREHVVGWGYKVFSTLSLPSPHTRQWHEHTRGHIVYIHRDTQRCCPCSAESHDAPAALLQSPACVRSAGEQHHPNASCHYDTSIASQRRGYHLTYAVAVFCSVKVCCCFVTVKTSTNWMSWSWLSSQAWLHFLCGVWIISEWRLLLHTHHCLLFP